MRLGTAVGTADQGGANPACGGRADREDRRAVRRNRLSLRQPRPGPRLIRFAPAGRPSIFAGTGTFPGAETDPALSGIGGARTGMGSPTPGSCSAMPGRTTRDRCLQPPVFQSMPNVNAGAFCIHRGSPQSVPWRPGIDFAQRVHEPRLSELRRADNFSEIPPGSDCFGYPDSGVDAHRSPHPKSAVAERHRVDPCPLASAGRGVVRTQQNCDHWWWAR